MSAEGKKKRGESGVSNAKHRPFRLGGGGAHPNHYAAVVGTLGLNSRIGKPQAGSAFDRKA